MTEEQLHISIIQYLEAVLPPHVVVAHIPNQAGPTGKRSVGFNAKMKKLGRKSGMPDIMLIYGGRAFFLEVKTERGRLSKVQRACFADLVQAGCWPLSVRSIDDVRDALKRFMIPTNEVHYDSAIER